ncbi:hypothetical protein BDV18DRAFT_135429 [Aspergillus unguis]
MSSPTTELNAFPMPEMADMPAPMFSPPTVPRRDDRPLRSSCGECNQAKVKCSKDRPTCRRCATRGTTCVYGVSMRGIKRPRPSKQSEPPKARRRTSPPSPIPSETVPITQSCTVGIPSQPAFFPDISTELYPGEFGGDDLDNFLNMHPFDPSIPDPSAFPFPTDLPLQDISIAPLPQQMPPAAPTPNLPLSPITPPGSRDGPFGTTPLCNSPFQTPSCCCQQGISFKLTELTLPKPPKAFNLDEFLAEHRANMALCTTVLDCVDPAHSSGMPLLLPVIALLVHMTNAFDQIPQANQTQALSFTQSQPPPPPPTPTSPTNRKEQITQANTVRAELAKLGALIQEFDRRYCGLDTASTSFGDDTFLLSPLFGNLQWKTQARFDAVRSWMPRL